MDMKNNKLGGRPSKCPDFDKLNRLYVEFSAREIAEMYGVPYETCRGWIKRAKKHAKEQAQAKEKE